MRKKDDWDTQYVKHVSLVLRKHDNVCGKNDITFRSGRENALSVAAFLSMTTNYIRTCYKEVKEMSRSCVSGIVCIENIYGNPKLFFSFVQ